MSEVAITPLLDVSSFKSMGSAVSRRVLVQPENLSKVDLGTATQDVYFALPSGRYSMINGQNSYLMFDAGFTGANSTAFLRGFSNGSASSAIRGMELIIGNTSVEMLDRYNVFAALVEDFQGAERSKNVGNIMSGGNATFTKAPALAPAATAVPLQRYCIPIYSSVIGTLATQVCPAVDSIRLKLTFENLAIATQEAATTGALAGTTALTACAITNINLVMDYLDVDPVIHSQLIQESGGVFKTHGSGVANFSSTITASAGTSSSFLIPARYSSVKNYFTCWRNADTTGTNAGLVNSTGGRYYPAAKSIAYRIDGRQYPSIPIVAHNGNVALAGEAFAELIKCFDAANAVTFDCVFNLAEYTSQGTLPVDILSVTNNTDSFCIGVDFEEAVGGGRAVVSGRDTNSNNTFLEVQYNSATMPGLIVDTFAVYDNILECNMMTGEISVSK